MNRKVVFIILAITVLAAFNFLGKAHFRRRNALKVVETVLAHWQKNDTTLAMSYWEKKESSPPIYSLSSYEIGTKEFTKTDGIYHARIFVTLYFPTGNRSPSGREWIFELSKTRYGWKIGDFRLRR